MNKIDQRLRDASDSLDDVTVDVTPRSIDQLNRRVVRRNVVGGVTKGVAVLAVVIVPFVGWQLLSEGDSIGGPSSPIPTAQTDAVVTVPTSEVGTPETDVVISLETTPAPIDLSSPDSHDQVKQIIDDALVANGVDTTDAYYEGKETDPFTGYFGLMSEGSFLEIEVSAWLSGSMPDDPQNAGEHVSSVCTGVETTHGWVFLDETTDGYSRAAVIAPSAAIVASSSGIGTLETLQAVVQDIADQLGAATGQPFVPSTNVATATPDQACQAPSESDLTENPDHYIEQVFAEVFEANGLTLDGYGFGRDGDKIVYEGATVEPDDQYININMTAFQVSPIPESTDGDALSEGIATFRGEADNRAVRVEVRATVVDLTMTAAANGDVIPDDVLSAVALAIGKRIDGLW